MAEKTTWRAVRDDGTCDAEFVDEAKVAAVVRARVFFEYRVNICSHV
ncbi:MAG: hypothetical protein HQ592_11030 [Planctomycetes bacterium]|nr:hypothetical protein [Planctomycetota bacterium]